MAAETHAQGANHQDGVSLTRETIEEIYKCLSAERLHILCDMALRAEKAEREFAALMLALQAANSAVVDLQRELADARRKALEEAAGICDALADLHRSASDRLGFGDALNRVLERVRTASACADAIRALAPPQSPVSTHKEHMSRASDGLKES